VALPSTVRTDDQITAYFDMVNETLGLDVPWVLQDHPVATGVQMATGVILKILKNSPTCVMLKHEDCPGLTKLSALRAVSDKGELHRISILTSNGGGLFLPEELTDAYLPLARANIGLAVRKPGPKLSAQDMEDIARLTAWQNQRLTELG
jgi:4-hydroxy-tetrahydrodipicolinate synthase